MTDTPKMIRFLETDCTLVEDTSMNLEYPNEISRHVGNLAGARLVVAFNPRRSVDHAEFRIDLSARGAHLGVWGPSLEVCERAMREQITALDQSADNLYRAVFKRPTQTITKACENFIARWQQIPPLVRASYGYNIAKHTLRERLLVPGEANLNTCLSRRSRVNAAFDQASAALRQLAIDLTRQADDEAEDVGIDADVRCESVLESPTVEELTGKVQNRDAL